MFCIAKVFVPAVLVLGAGAAVLLAAADGNQPPPGGKGPFAKGDDKKGQPPKPDATVDAWVKVLLERITDPHDTVRDSARGALVAVGPPAVPALEALAGGNDPAKAVAARKIIGAIHAHHGLQPGQPGRGPGSPGGPGMAPTGPRGEGGGRVPDFRGGFPGIGPGGWGRGRDVNVEPAPMPRDVR